MEGIENKKTTNERTESDKNEWKENKPLTLLHTSLGKRIRIRTVDGNIKTCTLLAYDQHLNVTVQIERGQKIVVRGNSILEIEV